MSKTRLKKPARKNLKKETEKRYRNMLTDREKGQNWNMAKNIDDLFHQLTRD
ncbi:MAG: hypothetical protein Q7S61_03600 [bacterium]|nr:hypothetical protein [bacterium]